MVATATRWRVACGMGLVTATLAAPALAQAPAPRPPNVVFVMVDDLRWDDFGAAGHPFVETPSIDRIAREGARFVNAFATTPLCSPSRASFLTGQYAHTNGIVDNTARDALSHALPTFVRPLQKAGYETAFLGKWHMGNDASPRPGWSHWVAMRGQGEALDPLLNVDGRPVPTKGYVTDILTDYATRFVERAQGKPFVLFLAHKALHPNIVQRDDGSRATVVGQPEGFVAADRHKGRYAGAPLPRRPNYLKPPLGKPALQRRIDDLPPLGPDTGTTDREIRERLEMLLAVDEGLGRLMETLRRLGELDRTLLIFTGDHGYFYGEHGLSAERRLAYEESARIPLLVRYPPLVKPQSTPERLVLSIDLAPTILELAGVKPDAALQGRSLVPLIEGRAAEWRSSILTEYYSDTVFPRIRGMGYRAVRTERYKYITYLELPGMDELYDLGADPYELTNIVAAPEASDVLARMKAELARLRRETDDRAPTPTRRP